MNRFLIGAYLFVTFALVVLAAYYPQELALALGTFIVGGIFGGFISYNVITTSHDKGFERSQQLSMKQLTNPAAIMREQRLSIEQEQKMARPRQVDDGKVSTIPRINTIAGLEN